MRHARLSGIGQFFGRDRNCLIVIIAVVRIFGQLGGPEGRGGTFLQEPKAQSHGVLAASVVLVLGAAALLPTAQRHDDLVDAEPADLALPGARLGMPGKLGELVHVDLPALSKERRNFLEALLQSGQGLIVQSQIGIRKFRRAHVVGPQAEKRAS